MELPYAEDIKHYWQTSQSSPDVWIERARKLIEDLGGQVLAEGFGSMENHSAYMLAFEIKGDKFKVAWPVLPTHTSSKTQAAKRQAATMLYYDIKAKCMTASVLGARVAFFSYMLLPDGRTTSELGRPELVEAFPKLLTQRE